MKRQNLRKYAIVCGLVSGITLSGNVLAYTESLTCSNFSSISADAGAVMLGNVSNCDDCVETVSLPSTFNWWGDTPVNDIVVSSNGQIDLDSTVTSSNCCSADPVEIGGSYVDPRIAVAQEDLDPADGGDIYVLDTGSSFIIEYANVVFFPNNGEVNAQAELFPNGDVELRWGQGDTAGNSLAVGVEDDTRTTPAATPATGAPFGAGGVTGTFPGNQCRRFNALPGVTPVAPTPVPSMSAWGIGILAGLLGLIGMRRRVK